MSNAKFETGTVLITKAINNVMNESPVFSTLCQVLLDRHKKGDWGDLVEEDIETNEDALLNEGRILSSYLLSDAVKKQISVNEEKVWIITEWNRSATTILFPTDY